MFKRYYGLKNHTKNQKETKLKNIVFTDYKENELHALWRSVDVIDLFTEQRQANGMNLLGARTIFDGVAATYVKQKD